VNRTELAYVNILCRTFVNIIVGFLLLGLFDCWAILVHHIQSVANDTVKILHAIYCKARILSGQ
jgi:hypothetical protein